MKRFLLLLLAILLCFSVTACKKETPKIDEISISTKEPETENETKNETQDVFSDSRYIGEYENEPVYQKIMEFETCSDPNEFCELLEMLYGEAFSYSVMPCGEHTDHLYPIVAFYHFGSKDHLDSDAYVFCKAESEEPLFVMDGDGTYIVSETKEGQSEDGDEWYMATSWVMSDLFLCLHGYIDEDEETKSFYRDGIRYMDFYLDFENRIVQNTQGGSILVTESLTPSIEILSVECVEDAPDFLNVQYRIRNIQKSRGCIYLTCSSHAYQTQVFLNDENHKNEYREDGIYEYQIYYNNSTTPNAFTIFYGYGDFDANDGWKHACRATMYYLYPEDYGTIGSLTIPEQEIHPIYLGDEYVGAWTTHENGDLIEIDADSCKEPFERQNRFEDENGNVLTVQNNDGDLLFYINDVLVGSPHGAPFAAGAKNEWLVYEIEPGDGLLLITRYPKDEYLYVQGDQAYCEFDGYYYS